jgi:hypothetical protein
MPTVLRDGPYRFLFYSSDATEPPHIHVERDSSTAKFWLSPVRLGNSSGFGSREVRVIHRLVEKNRESFLRSWNAFFGG